MIPREELRRRSPRIRLHFVDDSSAWSCLGFGNERKTKSWEVGKFISGKMQGILNELMGVYLYYFELCERRPFRS